MVKKMAVARITGEHPLEVFSSVEQNFTFIEEGRNDATYITPYLIVTDGKNILVRVKRDDTTEIGWSFLIDKPLSVQKGPFAEIVEPAIIRSFWSYWKAIKVNETPPQRIKYEGDKVEKVGASYRGLRKHQTSIHCTKRGVFSLNRGRYSPVYFLILPSTSTINFIRDFDDGEYVRVIPYSSIGDLGRTISYSYQSRKIIDKIRSGEIIKPIISMPDEGLN